MRCLGWFNETVSGKEPEVALGKDLVPGDSTVPVPGSCRESGEASERPRGEFSAFVTIIPERPGGPTGPRLQAAPGTCCVVLGNAPDLWVCFKPEEKKRKKERIKQSTVERQRSCIFLRLPNNTAPGDQKLIRPAGLHKSGLCDFPLRASC